MPIDRTVSCIKITSYFAQKNQIIIKVQTQKTLKNMFFHEETTDFPIKKLCYKTLNVWRRSLISHQLFPEIFRTAYNVSYKVFAVRYNIGIIIFLFFVKLGFSRDLWKDNIDIYYFHYSYIFSYHKKQTSWCPLRSLANTG